MDARKDDLLALGMELRETHISEVYLSVDRVYKLKKPVQLGFLDFSTLEQRKRYCEAEVQLNQRLAQNVYHGVIPLVRGPDGVHRLGGDGEIVDYAVEMRRLADADAADSRLRRGQLQREHLAHIAQKLARFHAEARCDSVTERYGQVEAIKANVIENFEQTRDSARAFLDANELAAIQEWQLAFLTRERAQFEARIRAGRIRDGHGDLRLEHCYLDDASGDVQIIDCIEFNDRFRYGDVCADVAFLAMDLVWHERHDLSEAFLAAYAQAADDFDLYGVVDFYESYRAYVRGKVSSMLADDTHAQDTARKAAHAKARKYYMLAHACTREPLEPPKLYVITGGIASGKSSAARALSRSIDAPIIEADHVRKRLAGVDPQTPWQDAAFGGRYTQEQTDAVYGELLRRAEVVLRSGRSVILDATFRRRAQRAAVAELSQRLGRDYLFVECVAPEAVCKARLAERARGPSVSDGRLDIYEAVMRSFEALTDLPPERHVRLDTSGAQAETEAQLRAVTAR